MYHDDWGGLPDEAFLARLDPELVKIRRPLRRARRARPTSRAGLLTAEVAEQGRAAAGHARGRRAFDAHAGAVGAGIKPGTLVKIIGTSTCDMMVAPMDHKLADIPGLCGIVPGSIIPGMYGLEAGQSAVGDIFNGSSSNSRPHAYAAGGDPHDGPDPRGRPKLRPGESGLLALDWNNGNRTILVDPLLTGLLVGQTLHTTAAGGLPGAGRGHGLRGPDDHQPLRGVRRRRSSEVVNCGGIAEKNPFVMQIYADVCNRPMKISRSAQTCALGAAIFGAVVGGAYKHRRAGPAEDDRREARRLSAPASRPQRSTPSCTASTAGCTTPSARPTAATAFTP